MKSPHKNNTEDFYEFRKRYANTNLTEIGIQIMSFDDFMMNKNYKLWKNTI